MHVGVGGAYNVDEVLQLMVHGLDDILQMMNEWNNYYDYQQQQHDG